MLVALPPALVDAAKALHATPGRAYHTFEHVEEVLAWLDVIDAELAWTQPLEVSLAAIFHDAVYVAGRADNEIESARRAGEALELSLPEAQFSRVEELILATARHGKISPGELDPEAERFLDADMAILGASPDRFDAYDRAIAVEYAAVPPDVYAAGRRRFLEGLLAKPRIYLSEVFHARLDARARLNLRRALAG